MTVADVEYLFLLARPFSRAPLAHVVVGPRPQGRRFGFVVPCPLPLWVAVQEAVHRVVVTGTTVVLTTSVGMWHVHRFARAPPASRIEALRCLGIVAQSCTAACALRDCSGRPEHLAATTCPGLRPVAAAFTADAKRTLRSLVACLRNMERAGLFLRECRLDSFGVDACFRTYVVYVARNDPAPAPSVLSGLPTKILIAELLRCEMTPSDREILLSFVSDLRDTENHAEHMLALGAAEPGLMNLIHRTVGVSTFDKLYKAQHLAAEGDLLPPCSPVDDG